MYFVIHDTHKILTLNLYDEKTTPYNAMPIRNRHAYDTSPPRSSS